jgi:excisionase family DNA binding protein
MTVTETSRRIGVSASIVYQLVAARKIAHYRVGKKILFREDDVAAFLAGCRVEVRTMSVNPTVSLPKLKHVKLKA